MKYIKLFEEHNYSVYDLITMGANQVLSLLIEEIRKENTDLDLIRDILEYSVVDINGKGKDGKTALIWAVFWGHKKCVELLLNHPGIDVNVKNEYGETALMFAVRGEREKCIRLLLNHSDINIKLKNDNGKTSWDLAHPYIRERFLQLNPNY